jgi:hypothetical protein
MAAKLQLPILPSRLYRYRSLTRSATATAEEISSIRDGYLYCADFSVMNDPMEGLFRSSSLLRAHPDYRETVERIKDGKLGVGIACLSETYENMLMWAHYAGNFSGICFGYSSSELIDGLPGNTKLIRVAYLDKPSTIRPNDLAQLPAVARRTLSQKQYSWAYEREWRLLAPVTGRISYVPARPLRNIYLGPRISEPQKDLLLDAINDFDVSIYQMSLNGYVPDWEEVDIRARRRRRRGEY